MPAFIGSRVFGVVLAARHHLRRWRDAPKRDQLDDILTAALAEHGVNNRRNPT